MPSHSKKQHNFMEAVAHSPSFAKKAGVPQSVGKDFAAADKGKTFKHGGGMKKYADGGMPMVNKGGKMVPSFAADGVGKMAKGGEPKKMIGKEVAFMKKKGAPKSMLKHEEAEMKGMKAGGKVRRYGAGGGPLGDESIMTDEEYAKQRAAGAKNYENLKAGLGSMADFFMGRRSKDKASAPIERRDIDRTNEMRTSADTGYTPRPPSADTGYTPPLGTTKPNIQSPRTRRENESTSYSDLIEREDAAMMDKTAKGPRYTSSMSMDEGEYSGPSFKQEPRATRSSEPVRTRKPIGMEKTQTKERVITAPVKPTAKDVAKFSSDSPDLESRMEAMKPKRKFGMASDETRAAIRKGLGSALDFFDLSKAHEREFGKKMAKGGNVDGVAKKGKTEGKVVKMAAGGFVKTADGCAQRGKTKAFQVKMKRGGMC